MAGWRVWGWRYDTSELADTTVYQPVIFNKKAILEGCRIWVIAYNDPVFTSLSMKIYSDKDGLPKTLLHTSTNVVAKSDMLTLANGIKEIFFTFNRPTFNSTDTYHFVLNATGYTGNTGSHLAWMKAFPDPVYREGLTLSVTNLNRNPMTIYFIGAEL
jgi:hypothetical protein